MGYDNQFEDFDPLQPVPPFPFSELPGLAERALSFLKGESKEELVKRSHELDTDLMALQGFGEKNDKGKLVSFGVAQFVKSDFETLKEYAKRQDSPSLPKDFALIALWRVVDALRIGLPLSRMQGHIDSFNHLVIQSRLEDFDRLHGVSGAMYEASEAVSYAESLRESVTIIKKENSSRSTLGADARSKKAAEIRACYLAAYWKDLRLQRGSIEDAAEELRSRRELRRYKRPAPAADTIRKWIITDRQLKPGKSSARK